MIPFITLIALALLHGSHIVTPTDSNHGDTKTVIMVKKTTYFKNIFDSRLYQFILLTFLFKPLYIYIYIYTLTNGINNNYFLQLEVSCSTFNR